MRKKPYPNPGHGIRRRIEKGGLNMPVAQGPKGMKQEMDKWKAGKLHSGSKKGPIVTSHAQAVAIALHESGMSNGGKKKK